MKESLRGLYGEVLFNALTMFLRRNQQWLFNLLTVLPATLCRQRWPNMFKVKVDIHSPTALSRIPRRNNKQRRKKSGLQNEGLCINQCFLCRVRIGHLHVMFNALHGFDMQRPVLVCMPLNECLPLFLFACPCFQKTTTLKVGISITGDPSCCVLYAYTLSWSSQCA